MRSEAVHDAPRRVLATRRAPWAKRTARVLAQIGFRPNAVSLASVVVALAVGLAFALAPRCHDHCRSLLLVMAALGIQLRLLCNLLDGMLAVEERLKSPTGDLYNELPDRVADVVILVGAGASIPALAWGPTLGWAAAVLALFTAYVRVLGGSLGVTQSFIGPMAKQHRMFTLTIATLAAAVEAYHGLPSRAMPLGLTAIVAGSVITAIRRTGRIVDEVRQR